MLRALTLAFAQLSDPASRRVVILSVIAAVLGFAGLFAAVEWALLSTALTDWSWVDTALDAMGGALVVALAWFLFPAVAAGVASFLLDPVVRRVEERHYPFLPAPRDVPLMEQVLVGLRFFLVVVAVNMVALPLYFVPGFNLIAYYTINGYLLGREYFELVALRRHVQADASELRRRYFLKLFSAGVIIAFLSTIPLVNLLVPVIAAAFMVHVFHTMKRS